MTACMRHSRLVSCSIARAPCAPCAARDTARRNLARCPRAATSTKWNNAGLACRPAAPQTTHQNSNRQADAAVRWKPLLSKHGRVGSKRACWKVKEDLGHSMAGLSPPQTDHADDPLLLRGSIHAAPGPKHHLPSTFSLLSRRRRAAGAAPLLLEVTAALRAAASLQHPSRSASSELLPHAALGARVLCGCCLVGAAGGVRSAQPLAGRSAASCSWTEARQLHGRTPKHPACLSSWGSDDIGQRLEPPLKAP
ncbi:hypothetical protein COO60DRAFT_1498441 [Scenedesmus sp. NREL 46B-D3]|nr:hypothetical protein COO60DRAFT_1498441 [Scenedesmus sp. NREL 46B-D3]